MCRTRMITYKAGSVFCLFGALSLTGIVLTAYNLRLSLVIKTARKLHPVEQFTGYKDTQPYDVLILTYMRSGSSFVGKILGWRSDTFYWYEPLWWSHTWTYLSAGQVVCNYGNHGCHNVTNTSSDQSYSKSLKFLLDVYTCSNLSQHYKGRFATALHGSYKFMGPTGDIYRTCNKSHKSHTFCYEKMIHTCATANHRVMKVLRMDTTHAQYLLDNHPRLKLIQVFRDPRGVVNSRLNTTWYYNKRRPFIADVEILCNRMYRDIESAKLLKMLYPNRVKIIQYEDFYNPQRLTDTLYSFVNMKMTAETKKMLSSMRTYGGFDPDHYREELAWYFVKLANKHCGNVFERLGLRVFENKEDYKNRNVSVIKTRLPFSID